LTLAEGEFIVLAMKTFTNLLPVLDSGLIFRARRAQLGLSLLDLQARSGVGIAGIRSLELYSAADFDKVRCLAPHLRLTDEQAMAMFTIQRQQMCELQKRYLEQVSCDDSPL
jgi:hypothetical protein